MLMLKKDFQLIFMTAVNHTHGICESATLFGAIKLRFLIKTIKFGLLRILLGSEATDLWQLGVLSSLCYCLNC